MEEGLLGGRGLLFGSSGQGGVHVHRAVEHHGADPVREQVGIDRSELGPVGQAVEADGGQAEGLTDQVHVPGRVDGVDEGLEGALPDRTGFRHGGEGGRAGQRLTWGTRYREHTGQLGRWCPAPEGIAGTGAPRVEAHDGEVAAHGGREQAEDDGEDLVPAFTRTARVEDQGAVRVGRIEGRSPGDRQGQGGAQRARRSRPERSPCHIEGRVRSGTSTRSVVAGWGASGRGPSSVRSTSWPPRQSRWRSGRIRPAPPLRRPPPRPPASPSPYRPGERVAGAARRVSWHPKVPAPRRHQG